jgi:hypothetical protein
MSMEQRLSVVSDDIRKQFDRELDLTIVSRIKTIHRYTVTCSTLPIPFSRFVVIPAMCTRSNDDDGMRAEETQSLQPRMLPTTTAMIPITLISGWEGGGPEDLRPLDSASQGGLLPAGANGIDPRAPHLHPRAEPSPSTLLPFKLQAAVAQGEDRGEVLPDHKKVYFTASSGQASSTYDSHLDTLQIGMVACTNTLDEKMKVLEKIESLTTARHLSDRDAEVERRKTAPVKTIDAIDRGIAMSKAKHIECRHITLSQSRRVPGRLGSEIHNPVECVSDDDEFKQPLSDTMGGYGVFGSAILVGSWMESCRSGKSTMRDPDAKPAPCPCPTGSLEAGAAAELRSELAALRTEHAQQTADLAERHTAIAVLITEKKQLQEMLDTQKAAAENC